MRKTIRAYGGDCPRIASSAYIDPTAVVIGKVTIGADASLWPLASVRGDTHSIWIGERTNIQDGTVIHATRPHARHPEGHPVTIGNDVTVGHRALLHACTIHSGTLIGMGALVLDGAIIEKEVLLAAGSLVPPKKRLESGYLYQGRPALRIRALRADELHYLKASANHYVQLKNDYLGTPLCD